MRRIFAIGCMAMAMIAAASSAFAQYASKATIPFDFHVGSTVMPAGDYKIWCGSSDTIWFRNQDGRNSAVAMSANSGDPYSAPTKLTFNVYRNQYFLAKTTGEHGQNERVYGMTKPEKRVREDEASLKTEKQLFVALK